MDTKNTLEIPLDSDSLADLLDRFATDAFEVMRFLEAMAAATGKTISRTNTFIKLLEKWEPNKNE